MAPREIQLARGHLSPRATELLLWERRVSRLFWMVTGALGMALAVHGVAAGAL
ncbi:hypothetical protein HER32_18945 [Hymenobacter sp. BT18]|uniref:hypothetical protein n=1 Tax=Hymenobacter TaxID=89966 RepID=UPI00143EBFF6|nr:MULTISPECIES: hypothetical protein [Hymenobacter]QIX63134.1 hypothetical protein HER32_18945 [Hymenobacter sp. BT18]